MLLIDESSERTPVLFVAAITSFLTPFMISSVNVTLPAIGKAFEMDAVTLGWVNTSFLMSAGVFLVPLGRLADIYGRKRILISGVWIFAIASLLSGLASTTVTLIALRILNGAGSAMIFGPSVAILLSVYPSDKRGRALGITIAAVYLGLSLGPIMGGVITQSIGWRGVFGSAALMGLLAAIGISLRLRGEWREAPGEHFDLTGSILYAMMLVALISGLSLLPDWKGGLLALLSLLAAVGFIIWESKAESPMVNIRLLRRNSDFTLSQLIVLIFYTATFGVSFLLSLYFQLIKGLSPGRAGVFLLIQPLVQAATSPIAGRVSDRFAPRLIASSGILLTSIGLFILSFLDAQASIALIVAGLAVIGVGYGAFSSPNWNAAMSSIERSFYGMASGIVGTMRIVGQMLSMGLIMLAFATMGPVSLTEEDHHLFLEALHVIFVVFGLLTVVGMFVSLGRGNRRA